MKSRGIALFFTQSSAIRAEKVSLDAGLKVKMIATPRELSSDCGMALQFEPTEKEILEGLLAAKRIEFDRLEELP